MRYATISQSCQIVHMWFYVCSMVCEVSCAMLAVRVEADLRYGLTASTDYAGQLCK